MFSHDIRCNLLLVEFAKAVEWLHIKVKAIYIQAHASLPLGLKVFFLTCFLSG